MPPTQKNDGLEMVGDLDFQRKEWTVERWGWIFMLIIVIAALLGLFGQGPLSSTAVENGPLRVQYGRFERLYAPAQFTIILAPSVAQNGEIRLQMDQRLMQAYTIDNVIPEPESVELSSDHYTYVFKTSQSGQLPDILFNLQAIRIGLVSGQIGLENGQAVQLNQFIFP